MFTCLIKRAPLRTISTSRRWKGSRMDHSAIHVWKEEASLEAKAHTLQEKEFGTAIRLPFEGSACLYSSPSSKIPWYEISRKLTPIAYHQVEPGESELVLSNNSSVLCKERCIRTRHESKYWTPRMSTIGMDLQRRSDQTWFSCKSLKRWNFRNPQSCPEKHLFLLKLKGRIPKIAIVHQKHCFTYKPIILGIHWLNFQGVTSW